MVFLVKKTIGLNQALGFFGLNQTTLHYIVYVPVLKYLFHNTLYQQESLSINK